MLITHAQNFEKFGEMSSATLTDCNVCHLALYARFRFYSSMWKYDRYIVSMKSRQIDFQHLIETHIELYITAMYSHQVL